MSKDTTDNTRELLRQFLFDYNMNTTAMGMDEEKALRGFLDSVMYLISNREKLARKKALNDMTVWANNEMAKDLVRKELDREEPTHE